MGIARTRLTISISLYSAFLGSGANLIAVLAQTSHYEVALQLSLVSTFWFCIFGAVGALLIVPISIYHFREDPMRVSDLATWFLLALGFAVSWPFVTAAFFPVTLYFIHAIENGYGLSIFLSGLPDEILKGFNSFFIFGAATIYTGILAGLVFGIGGIVIDTMDVISNRYRWRYASMGVSIILGVTILGFCIFGPIELLTRFG